MILGLAQYSKHWLAKYGAILGVLSNYPPIMLGSSEEVHCFGEAMVGLEAHEEFRVNPERMPNGEMMVDFQVGATGWGWNGMGIGWDVWQLG